VSDLLSPAEGREVVRLCEAGRLYEVEAWNRSGKPLAVPREVRKTPLAAAMSSGFHSLVELLLRHEPSQEAENDVLEQALLFDRPAFVELALTYGADIKSAPFVDVLMTGNRALVATFLEKGADPTTGHPFAHALHQLRAKTIIGSYLDCRRSRPDLASQLQEQMDDQDRSLRMDVGTEDCGLCHVPPALRGLRVHASDVADDHRDGAPSNRERPSQSMALGYIRSPFCCNCVQAPGVVLVAVR
jgi:hypothetical protein